MGALGPLRTDVAAAPPIEACLVPRPMLAKRWRPALIDGPQCAVPSVASTLGFATATWWPQVAAGTAGSPKLGVEEAYPS